MPVSFMQVHPAAAEPNTLRYRLHKGMNETRPGRDLGTIHASSMTGDHVFCGRQRTILQLKGQGPPSDHIPAATRATYDFGDAVEALAVHWLADVDLAVGNWECVCGKMTFMQLRPKACDSCGCRDPRRFFYRQRRFASETSRISCGIDCFVRGMAPRLRAVEIKSIMKDDFAKLAAPLVEHRERTSLYLRCISESIDQDVPNIDTETGYVLYVCKGGYIKDPEVVNWKFGDRGFTPFKDYEIKRDEKLTDAHFKRAVEYHQDVVNKVIPARICASSTDKNAKGCPVTYDCFSSKFSPGSKFG